LKKKGDKKGDKKFDKKGDKKGKKFDKKKRGGKKDEKDEKEEVVEEEEKPDENEGKTTFEDYEKNRKKPVSISSIASRKARQGVKVHSKQLEFVRPLEDKEKQVYMRVSKKKELKKVETKTEVKTEAKTETKTEVKTEVRVEDKSKTAQKKKKVKQLSTAEFFKGTQVPKKNFKRRDNDNNKGTKQGKKPNLNLTDSKDFPGLK